MQVEHVGPLRRWTSRLLDGGNRWGSVHVQADRFGAVRYRLVVYPPGISDAERRRLRLWRGAPVWGTALWVLAEIVLQHFMAPRTALVFSTGLVIASVAFAFTMAGPTRGLVRMMRVDAILGHSDATIAARDRLYSLASILQDADERLDAGLISPLEHEALWWRVYDQLDPGSSNVRKLPS
jgi:hypothetical protein